MDTYTLFTEGASHLGAHIAIWGSLAFATGLVFYWAATTENNVENNPDK